MADFPGTYPVADDVVRVPIFFVNAYLVGPPGGPWVLVDTGLPGAAGWIRRAAEAHHGDVPPQAIVLTHGHFDHAGNAAALADAWGVPIFAHDAELPFLTGRSDYPPQDPTPGGAIAFLSRFFPTAGYDFGARVQPLPADGSVGLDGWRWLHTPGHAPGHVALFREADRTLLAGDAVATMDLDSWVAQVTHAREVSRSPVPFVPDWEATAESVRQLAALRPRVLAAGHGREITDGAADRLAAFAERSHRPEHGRYVPEPARFDDDAGVVSVPPPVPDRTPALVAGGTLGAVLLSELLKRRRR
ncbi:MBL fold metallo-hydrolase [Rubrivirga sp.]|uniref:MBL fold metallo-hydrolase n=1 Tax=Rubrivirga sp. TaxID=1885344 RepID=UPI003B51E8CF